MNNFDVAGYGDVMLSAQDLARRVGEGSLPLDRVKIGIQMLSEGGDPSVIKANSNLLSVNGLKRLTLEPDRPLDSWRKVLQIERRDWSDDMQTYFDEPEPWEKGLSEVWYDVEAPSQSTGSLEASNLLFGRGLHGFRAREGGARTCSQGSDGADRFDSSGLRPQAPRAVLLPGRRAACDLARRRPLEQGFRVPGLQVLELCPRTLCASIALGSLDLFPTFHSLLWNVGFFVIILLDNKRISVCLRLRTVEF
jgi:hypothetical protein